MKKKNKIEQAAYDIVCRMIDAGFIESELEGLSWEYDIQKILVQYFN